MGSLSRNRVLLLGSRQGLNSVSQSVVVMVYFPENPEKITTLISSFPQYFVQDEQSRETDDKCFQSIEQEPALGSRVGKESFRRGEKFEGWEAPPLACLSPRALKEQRKGIIPWKSLSRTPTFSAEEKIEAQTG